MLVDTWAMDSRKQFAFSFDNTFKQRADSVYALMGDKKEHYVMKYKLNSYSKAVENLIYPNTIWGILPTSFVFKMNIFVSPLFILIGVLGFLGFWVYFRTYWKGTMIYVSLMATLVFCLPLGMKVEGCYYFIQHGFLSHYCWLVSCFLFEKKIHVYDEKR